ncbi:site-specific integrase [Halobellus sp. Atlit-38R]|uniref:tyrosine-type recombinase/integrase n=1 Tax=Halobellus sp. Atlit-38R TaxID=2282131 RepID=UPI000EF229BB|nr:tyrosine-type recombinase/integrase [Halobellus sp. Atlit-38R]RLM89585.1 site-specific integrase [Halobellus sp. Atlit-38R]
MSDPPEFEPREAAERWLERQRLDKARQTVKGYRHQLKLFWEFCEHEDIERLGELTPWDIQQFETARRANDLATVTLRNELLTLRQFLEHYESLGVVDERVIDSIELPNVSKDEQTSETILETAAAKALLQAFREDETRYPRGHAFLELTWYTGARMGGIRSLDIDDVDFQEGYVQFRHRPDQDTPLKNAYDGERAVGISDDVIRALREYVVEHRPSVTDDYGRRPLFASVYGRLSLNALRATSYYATIPCRYGRCPHGKERTACGWTSQNQASKCPSSRSPHQIRAGSITWQLNRGIRADVVAERVNASVGVIEQHYDKADPVEEFRHRRKRHLDKLDFGEEDK